MNNDSSNNNNTAGDSHSANPLPPSLQAHPADLMSTAVGEFSDDVGSAVGISVLPDRLDHVGGGDESLSDYFARPVIIATYTWASTAFTAATISPWSLWAANTYVKNKLTNYSMFRGTLHVRAVFNGTPFQAGCLQVSYAPGPSIAVNSPIAGVCDNWNYARGSQLRNFELYGSGSSSGEIVAPFIFQKPFCSIPSGLSEFGQLGRLQIQQVVPLTSANAETVIAGTVQVFAWMTDVQLRVATYKNAMLKKGAKKETEPDFNISRPATMVSKVAGVLTTVVPEIAPFTSVVSMVAGGVAAIASAFGYSKPNDLRDRQPMIPRYFGPMAITEGLDSSMKITADPKQAVSVGPGWAGLPGEPDPLAIATIAARESMALVYPDWTTVKTAGTILFSYPVHPHGFNPGLGGSSYEMLPLSYAAAPFRYWTGSIVLRIKVIVSPMVRGRLLIWHYPHNDTGAAALTTTDITNTMQCCFLDVGSDTDVEFVVRPSMTRPWLNVGRIDQDFTTGAPQYNGNGRIYVSVLNELSAPAAGSASLIFYVRGGKDFEVAVPALSQIVPITWNQAMLRGVDSSVPAGFSGGSGKPMKICDLTERAGKPAEVEPFFGERIASLRALAKRYTARYALNPTYAAGPASISTALAYYAWDHYGVPPYAGHTAHNWTWEKWAMVPHRVVRGGIRFKIVSYTNAFQSAESPGLVMGLGRMPTTGLLMSAYYTFVTVGSSASSAFQQMAQYFGDGAELTQADRQPVLEVEFPYYSPWLFDFIGSLSTTYAYPDSVRFTTMSQALNGNANVSNYFQVYSAAADDFSATEWTGIGSVTISAASDLGTAFSTIT